MLSYTKAVLDYNIATQHKKKNRAFNNELTKIKVYYPSVALLEWRESVAEVDGKPSSEFKKLKAFVAQLESALDTEAIYTGHGFTRDDGKSKLVVKTMNNRYKLCGDYCVRLYYGKIHLPLDPSMIADCIDVKALIDRHDKFSKAYSVSKEYVKKLHNRKVILSDEF